MPHKKCCPDCLGGGQMRVALGMDKFGNINSKTQECQTCNGTGWYRKPKKVNHEK